MLIALQRPSSWILGGRIAVGKGKERIRKNGRKRKGRRGGGNGIMARRVSWKMGKKRLGPTLTKS